MSATEFVVRRREFSRPQLTLIRRTLARECNDTEFDQFIETAQSSGLDPLRRQIAPLILSANDPEQRRLAPLVTIDGLRVIAARNGDYRPMETAPIVETSSDHIDVVKNPLGIVRAEVRAWKYRDRQWHPIVGEAWWDEYAPLRKLAGAANDLGEQEARLVLDASWRRMPRLMIAKCAEALALRRGWPDLLSGLYGEEEMHRVRRSEETASDTLKRLERVRLAHQTKQALWFVFDPGVCLESVSADEVFERAATFYHSAGSQAQIDDFLQRNQQSLQIFWDWRPQQAFALKTLAEARLAALSDCSGDLPENSSEGGVHEALQLRADARPVCDDKVDNVRTEAEARLGSVTRKRSQKRQDRIVESGNHGGSNLTKKKIDVRRQSAPAVFAVSLKNVRNAADALAAPASSKALLSPPCILPSKPVVPFAGGAGERVQPAAVACEKEVLEKDDA